MAQHPESPPKGYHTPPFPSLNVKTLYDTTPEKIYTLYHVQDVWRFTVLWTLIVYALFHLGAGLIAFITHGPNHSTWKYLWAVPVVYLSIAGVEALLSGSVTGLM